MATTFVYASFVGAGTQFNLLTGAGLFVASRIQVISYAGTAITADATAHDIVIAGEVAGQAGIDMAIGVNTAKSLTILPGGSVTAMTGSAAYLVGNASTLTNRGDIFAPVNAVTLGADSGWIFNYGNIESLHGYGIEFFSNTDSPDAGPTLINYGTIKGDKDGAAVRGDITSADTVRNYGSIIGSLDQGAGGNALFNAGRILGDVIEGPGADTVSNIGGTITGDVFLYAGDDKFDGRGGKVDGTVFGDAGADSFIGNAFWVDIFDGGPDRDTLDFRVQDAVVLALDGAFDTAGAAQGDSYTGFENIMGSRSGNDQLRGDLGSNTLYGVGGEDKLDGAGGSDFLRGGNGADLLLGGGGGDTFAYVTLFELGDTIGDFSSDAVGNNDRFQISASGFGGGLVAGALAASQFRSRADNVAQDADDRFIFRTTDKTLWFDADGNGAGAAVMIADLQASATMTALDIVLV